MAEGVVLASRSRITWGGQASAVAAWCRVLVPVGTKSMKHQPTLYTETLVSAASPFPESLHCFSFSCVANSFGFVICRETACPVFPSMWSANVFRNSETVQALQAQHIGPASPSVCRARAGIWYKASVPAAPPRFGCNACTVAKSLWPGTCYRRKSMLQTYLIFLLRFL